MEIERKFLIRSGRFPDSLEEVERAQVEQGYLCLEPQVRIRKSTTEAGENFILCIKGKGELARTEVETALTETQYYELKGLLDRRMITKEYRKYKLPSGGLFLEVSIVNKGYPEEFMYAEIEFPSVELAKAYKPGLYLKEEITYSPDYRMSKLWLMLGEESKNKE